MAARGRRGGSPRLRAVCVSRHVPIRLVRGEWTSPTRRGQSATLRTTVLWPTSGHEKRLERLLEEGVTAEELKRVKSPIGLDIGGRTPEETAVSIVAEIIALRTGRNAPSLSEAKGSIH